MAPPQPPDCHSSCSCGGSAATSGWSLSISPILAAPPGEPRSSKKCDVGVVVVLPLLRGVVLVEDRLDRADRLAGTAVDALVGVDVEHPLALVDAVDRALVDAGPVLQVDARLGDDVGHRVPPGAARERVRADQPSIPACVCACPTMWPAHLGPHVVGQRVVVRRVLPGRDRPSGGPAMTDVLGICTRLGRRSLRRCPTDGRGAGHHRDRRHRLRQAGAAAPLDPAPGLPARGPAARRWPCGPTSRPSRSGDWLAAAPLRDRRRARRANSVLAMGAVRRRRRLRARGRALRRRGPAGRSPRCCRDSPRTRSSAATAGCWRATTPTRVFQLASVAAARRRARRRRHLRAVVVTDDGGLVTAPRRRARRRASRRTTTTGSASAASRSPRSTGAAGLGLPVMAALLGVGRRARRDHGVPPGARRQRAGARALRRAGLHRPPRATATSPAGQRPGAT